MSYRGTLLLVVSALAILQGSRAGVARGDGSDQEERPTTGELLTEALKYYINATASHGTSCPEPYSAVLNECFYIHQFVPLLSWEEARTFCQSAGGDLAQPEFFGALIAYLYEFKKVAQTVYDIHQYYLWLGGQQEEGEIRWLSGESIQKGDPENAYGEWERDPQERTCLMLNLNRNHPHALVTSDCSIKRHYVCELPLQRKVP
ncbi:uncharacterized protein [Panulirus ornatus]